MSRQTNFPGTVAGRFQVFLLVLLVLSGAAAVSHFCLAKKYKIICFISNIVLPLLKPN